MLYEVEPDNDKTSRGGNGLLRGSISRALRVVAGEAPGTTIALIVARGSVRALCLAPTILDNYHQRSGLL